jgi:hypothetical protein
MYVMMDWVQLSTHLSESGGETDLLDGLERDGCEVEEKENMIPVTLEGELLHISQGVIGGRAPVY